MNSKNNSLEFFKKFNANDVVSTFLYASAVNVILATSAKIVTPDIWIPLVIIVFIFIDWMSRVTISVSLPSEDQENRNEIFVKLCKAGLEILIIFSLVTTACRFLEPTTEFVTSTKSFSVFLITCFIWNLLIFKIMEGVRGTALFVAVFTGSAYDVGGARRYTTAIDVILSKAHKKTTSSSGKPSEALKDLVKYGYNIGIVSSVRVFGQLVVSHFTWLNLALGIVLLFEVDLTAFSFWGFRSDHPFLNSSYYMFAFFVAIPFVLYFIINLILYDKVSFDQEPEENKIQTDEKNEPPLINFHKECGLILKGFFIITGMLTFLITILFYSTFRNDWLIVILLIQQAIVGIFMRVAIPKEMNSNVHKNNLLTVVNSESMIDFIEAAKFELDSKGDTEKI